MAHFIEEYWLKNSHLWGGEMITRFPPEPNGHSHAGHAFSPVGLILLLENQRFRVS